VFEKPLTSVPPFVPSTVPFTPVLGVARNASSTSVNRRSAKELMAAEIDDLIEGLKDCSLETSVVEVLQGMKALLDDIVRPNITAAVTTSRPSSPKRTFEDFSSGDEADDDEADNSRQYKRLRRTDNPVFDDGDDDDDNEEPIFEQPVKMPPFHLLKRGGSRGFGSRRRH